MCRHHFPKQYCATTVYAGPEQRTVHRRRSNKAPPIINSINTDNEYKVSTKLLRALKCLMNMQVYQPVLKVKCLFNYLVKGEHEETIQIRHYVDGEPGIAVCDEVHR